MNPNKETLPNFGGRPKDFDPLQQNKSASDFLTDQPPLQKKKTNIKDFPRYDHSQTPFMQLSSSQVSKPPKQSKYGLP